MTPSTMASPTIVRTSDPLPEAPVIFFAPPSAGRLSRVSSPAPDAASAWAGASSTRPRAAEAAPKMKGGIRNGTDRLGRDESPVVIGRSARGFKTNIQYQHHTQN